jgi:GTPase involved in cell partitioning and DNA repair
MEELFILRDELRKYSATVAQQRSWLIAGNKIDLDLAKVWEFSALIFHEKLTYLVFLFYPGEPMPSAIVPISAKTGLGMPELIEKMRFISEESGYMSDEDDL